jgi:hypothetical protein
MSSWQKEDSNAVDHQGRHNMGQQDARRPAHLTPMGETGAALFSRSGAIKSKSDQIRSFVCSLFSSRTEQRLSWSDIRRTV